MNTCDFQYYIEDGQEHFVFGGKEKSFPFPEILLRIVNTGPRAPRARVSSATLPETSATQEKAV